MTRKQYILLVDDSAEVRLALRRLLERKGYEIHEAQDGYEASDLCRARRPDAIISDFDMPGMNGLAFLQHVRVMWPEIPRLLLTGRADVEVAARALNEGAVDRLILKPWDCVDLVGIVDLLIHTGAGRGRRVPAHPETP